MANLPLTEKALYFISYDQYKDEHMLGFLRDDVWTLDQYLALHPMVVQMPSMRRGVYGFPPFLPGELSNNTVYHLASEKSKKLSYSMLWIIWDTYEKGYCLGNFDEQNILVCSSGRAKFHDVLLILKEDKLLEDSLLNAHKILHRVFTKDGFPIPEDIKHLLDLLLRKTLVYRELFHVHASLILRPNRFSALIKMHEKVKYGLSPNEQKTIYMNLPYIHIWKARVMKNFLLKKSFYHRKGNYKDPNNWTSLPLDELSKIRGEKNSDYMRNSTAHRMEPMNVHQGQAHAGPVPIQSHGSHQQAQQNFSLPHLQLKQQQNHQGQGYQGKSLLYQGHGIQLSHQQSLNQTRGTQLMFRQPMPMQQQQGYGSKSQGQTKGQLQQFQFPFQTQLQYTPDEFYMVHHAHYPMFLVQMQEEIFKVNPQYLKDLNLDKLLA